jgi:hypothetical protein
MKEAASGEGAVGGVKRGGSPLKIGAPGERSKKIKKIVDDLPAILNLARTSADASRYLMYGKGGWPHEPTEPVAFMEEAVGRVIK